MFKRDPQHPPRYGSPNGYFISSPLHSRLIPCELPFDLPFAEVACSDALPRPVSPIPAAILCASMFGLDRHHQASRIDPYTQAIVTRCSTARNSGSPEPGSPRVPRRRPGRNSPRTTC